MVDIFVSVYFSPVASVIFFTPEFKEVMYDTRVNDQSIRDVPEEHGIAPEILGDTRIYNITHTHRAQGA